MSSIPQALPPPATIVLESSTNVNPSEDKNNRISQFLSSVLTAQKSGVLGLLKWRFSFLSKRHTLQAVAVANFLTITGGLTYYFNKTINLNTSVSSSNHDLLDTEVKIPKDNSLAWQIFSWIGYGLTAFVALGILGQCLGLKAPDKKIAKVPKRKKIQPEKLTFEQIMQIPDPKIRLGKLLKSKDKLSELNETELREIDRLFTEINNTYPERSSEQFDYIFLRNCITQGIEKSRKRALSRVQISNLGT